MKTRVKPSIDIWHLWANVARGTSVCNLSFRKPICNYGQVMVMCEDIRDWYNSFGKYTVRNYKIISIHSLTSRILEIYSKEISQKKN